MADLRAEVGDLPGSEREAWLAAVGDDWRRARLEPLEGALCAFAEKLTLRPAAMTESDLAPLRAAGLDDVGVHDAVQVIAYFNYVNRVADALHVEPEPET